MPKTKKKKPDLSRSEKRAYIFMVANVVILCLLSVFVDYYNYDRIMLLGLWGFITIGMVIFLKVYDRKAAEEFMDINPWG